MKNKKEICDICQGAGYYQAKKNGPVTFCKYCLKRLGEEQYEKPKEQD